MKRKNNLYQNMLHVEVIAEVFYQIVSNTKNKRKIYQ